MNLNSTGLGLGRFWPIFLQNDKSRTLHVAVRGLNFAGDPNMNLNLNSFFRPIFPPFVRSPDLPISRSHHRSHHRSPDLITDLITDVTTDLIVSSRSPDLTTNSFRSHHQHHDAGGAHYHHEKKKKERKRKK